MTEYVNPSKDIVVDTCHIRELRDDPLYFERVHRYKIFRGATVYVCKPALDEATSQGEDLESIRAKHKQLGAKRTVYRDLTPEMEADAVEMVRRHEKLHPPADHRILAFAKHTGYTLCTRDGPLVEVARAEGVRHVNPSKTYGSSDALFEYPPAARPHPMPSGPNACPVPTAENGRRRLPRRACPDPSDPRFRLVSGRPARGIARKADPR